MFKFFIGFILAMLSFASYSAQINVDGLNEAQIAELKAIAAKTSAENKREQDPTALISTATNWGIQASEAAEGFGKAFTTAARELGITVNEFLQTDAGKLTAILIVWKVAGVSILKLFFGSIVFITGMTVVRFLFLRIFTKEFIEVEYSHLFGVFKGTKLKRVPKPLSELTGDGEWFFSFLTIGLIVAIVGITYAIIF